MIIDFTARDHPFAPYNTILIPIFRPKTLRDTLGYKESFKRLIDILVTLTLLVCFMPLILSLALLVRLTSIGPAIYCQRRQTKEGKIFVMYKFRTMAVDSERDSGAVFADAADSRVTKLGKIMRRTRLDELPQLFNVLTGEMSLIGPRPERPEIAADLRMRLPQFEKRLAIKAGLSGLAQTRLGYSSSIEHYRRKLELDAIYVDNCGFLLDLKIALKTMMVVISGFGAR